MLRSLLVQAVEKGSAEKVRRRPSTSTTPTGSPTHRFGRFGKRGPLMVCQDSACRLTAFLGPWNGVLKAAKYLVAWEKDYGRLGGKEEATTATGDAE